MATTVARTTPMTTTTMTTPTPTTMPRTREAHCGSSPPVGNRRHDYQAGLGTGMWVWKKAGGATPPGVLAPLLLPAAAAAGGWRRAAGAKAKGQQQPAGPQQCLCRQLCRRGHRQRRGYRKQQQRQEHRLSGRLKRELPLAECRTPRPMALPPLLPEVAVMPIRHRDPELPADPAAAKTIIAISLLDRGDPEQPTDPAAAYKIAAVSSPETTVATTRKRPHPSRRRGRAVAPLLGCRRPF